MATFKYRAIHNDGNIISGTYTADEKSEILKMLRENQYYPIEVNQVISLKNIKLHQILNIGNKDMAIFCRKVYTMLNAGIPLAKIINLLLNQIENKRLRLTLKDVYEDLQKGMTFSESLKKYPKVFKDLFVNLIEAGEISGSLDIVMKRLMKYYEKEYQAQRKVKEAMVYPIILCIIAIGITGFMLVFVLPNFQALYKKETKLPFLTTIILQFSNFLISYWYLNILIAFLIILTIVYLIQKHKYIIDFLKLNVPIIKNITNNIIILRFTRTMATLMSSGISLMKTIDISAKVVGNNYVELNILKVKKLISKGKSLSDSLNEIEVFPPTVISMIKIGEESGTLDDILEKTANYYENEVESIRNKLITMIEPIMIIIMAVIIGGIMIAMILPLLKTFESFEY